MRSLLSRVLLCSTAVAVTTAALAAGPNDARVAGSEVPLIPRRVLFDNPDKAAPRISPDGARVSWLAPVDGVMNVWVAPAGDLSQAKPVTRDTNRGIRVYFWAFDNQHVVYLQDKGGDENWRVFSANAATGEVRDLTPFDGVAARIEGVSQRIPGEILVGLNNRNPAFHDVHRVNLATGEMTLVQENPGMMGRGMVNGFMTDADYKVRFAAVLNSDDGSLSLLLPPGGDGADWKEFTNIPMEDQMSSGPLGFDKTGKVLYMSDSRGRDTGAVFTWDLATGEKKMVAEDPLADSGSLMIHPTTYEIQAVAFEYDRERWKIVDKSIAPDFEALRKLRDGDFEVVSRTLDDKRWVVAFISDTGPIAYYLWDRPTQKAQFLFNNRSALEKYVLAPMRPVIIKSRDNLNLVSYLTLPVSSASPGAERPNEPLPMVLLVHGGPWARDSWGYNGLHQMLANRGYAVLSVNFRGSTGFGKNFVNAGNKEWAGKMHNDLIDAVDWAVAERIADPARVAIMGGSYGGYATLVGLTFTPEKFACGVDIVGPSNIVTLLNTIPPYWAPAIKMFKDRVGDHTSPEGQAFLHERSPLTHVDKIQRPLLIGQGANDPRVKQSESDQIVEAMQKKGIPVSYVLFPDEGHGFARPENNLSFFAVTDAFLSEHLGGRTEPISSNDFAGSTIQVPTGASGVPGLTEALPR
ncbi:MAG: S9 family peptidase [Phycisphaerales bacterium]|nr:S9 family peptidase [Phycisphaerales bacterium]